MIISDDRVRCVLKNFRLHMPKIWNRQKPNWVVVKELFAYGSTSAVELCLTLNIDPEGFEI